MVSREHSRGIAHFARAARPTRMGGRARLVLVALVAVGALGATALDAVGDSPVTIKFAAMSGSVGGFQARAQVFESQHPGINVQVQGVPGNSWGQVLQTIEVNIAGGDVPDSSDMATEGLRAFADNGLLTPLDSYIKKDNEAQAWLRDMAPSLVRAGQVNGKTYGIPTVWNSMVIYYNKKVLKAAGLSAPKKNWTIQNFLSMCKQVQTRKAAQFCYAFDSGYFTTIVPWMLTSGGNVLSSNWSKANMADPGTVSAVQLLHDFIYKYKISPKLDTSIAPQQLFEQGKIAFMLCGQWCVNGLKLDKFNSADYDVAYMPKVKVQQNIIGVGNAPIFAASKHQDAAWQFARFLSSPQFQATFVVADGWSTPSSKHAFQRMLATPGFPKNGHIFYDAAYHGVLVPAPKQYGKIESIVTSTFTGAMSKSGSVTGAMQAANKSVANALRGS